MNHDAMSDYYALTSSISPRQVSRYLHAQGWELIERREGLYEEWAEPTSRRHDSAAGVHLLPLNDEYRDFRRRYVEFLNEIAAHYGVGAIELANRVRLDDADVLLFRIAHDEESDEAVNFDTASDVMSLAHRMLAMAARYTVDPDKEFTGRMPSQARDYVKKHVFLGHTQRGSFVIPVLSGLRAAGGSQAIFARRVMDNLAAALDRVRSLVAGESYSAESDEFAPLVVALTDALQTFLKNPDFKALEISFRWASGRRAIPETPDRSVTLSPGSIRGLGVSGVRIREHLANTRRSQLGFAASRSDESRSLPVPAVRSTEETEISGKVVALLIDDRLVSKWGSRYSVVIRTSDPNPIGDVEVPVDENTFDLASRARDRGILVSAVGALTRSASGLVMRGVVQIADGRRLL
ncbi:hypothetical protein ACIQUP_31030 [Streptomyces nigra]|uniref:hypothetical protein n=1 Tax=Streptomyces nigra TaxID=1827580 RepID=UPI003822FBAE